MKEGITKTVRCRKKGASSSREESSRNLFNERREIAGGDERRDSPRLIGEKIWGECLGGKGTRERLWKKTKRLKILVI